MFNILLFLCLAQDKGYRINLDDLGMYNRSFYTCYRVDDRIIFLDAVEKAIASVDSGSKVFRYAKPGQGPGEIDGPSFMSCSKKKFTIISLSGKVDTFDKTLNPQESEIAKLPPELSGQYFYGRHLGNNVFMLFGGRREFLVYKVKFADGKWNVLSRQMPAIVQKGATVFDSNRSRVLVHGNYLFETMERLREIYEINVRLIDTDGVISGKTITLAQDLQGFPALHDRTSFRAFIQSVVKTPTGYAVEFNVSKETQVGGYNPSASHYITDFFDEDGSFKGRHELHGRIIPINNTEEVLFLSDKQDGEEMIVNWTFKSSL